MRVLIGCEESGRVREAFRLRGHFAMSADFLPSAIPGPHHQGDVLDVLDNGWDLAIFHPTCTYLTNSGAKHLYSEGRKENGPDWDRWAQMEAGANFFKRLLGCGIPRVAVENPIMHGHALEIVGERPTQIVQPWMFGHTESKATGLWLRGLPKLTPTRNVYGAMMQLPERERNRVHHMAPGKNRQRDRSRTYHGIADAFAEQWGGWTQEIAA